MIESDHRIFALVKKNPPRIQIVDLKKPVDMRFIVFENGRTGATRRSNIWILTNGLRASFKVVKARENQVM